MSTECSTAKFVIKMDADVDIQPKALFRALWRQYAKRPEFIIGKVKLKDKPIRKENSKWYVTKEEYSDVQYPQFVAGPTYGYTASIAPYLYQASLRVPFLYLEDVYVTGLCRKLVNVPLVVDPDFHFHHRSLDHQQTVLIDLYLLAP